MWTALTMSDEPFENRWRADLAFGSIGVQLARVTHPLEIYVGASDLGRPRVQVRSAMRPALPELADIVVVDRAQHGQAWVLTLTLQDAHFLEVFIRLTVDVVDRTQGAGSEEDAFRRMDAVFEQWRRLLTPAPLRRLGIDALRGLVGELWYLNRVAASAHAFPDALTGWLGPLGSPQDFFYASSGLHEVKAVGPTARSFKVSSAEQLDADLELVVLLAPQVPAADGDATNLVLLVDEAVGRLDDAGATPEELDLRLKRLGVDLTDEYYRETWFKVQAVSAYRVTTDFPAVRASKLRPGVEFVRYDVALAAIEPFKTEIEKV